MLTPDEEAAAIKYNRRQWGEGIGVEGLQCRRIQRTVDAGVDGLWGPITVNAAAVWQAAHGLVADGMVGAATTRLMVSSCEQLRVSAWAKRTLSQWHDHWDEYVEALRSIGAENVALMLNSQSDETWELSKWNNDLEALAAVAMGLGDEGFTVTYTAWPQPDPEFLAAMSRDLRILVETPRLAFHEEPLNWAPIELDVEGHNWPAGPTSDAAAFELEWLLRVPGEWPAVSVTTHPSRMHAGYKVTTTADQLAVQAYSYYGPPERAWCKDDGPGQRQEKGIAACWDVIASRRRPGRIIVGLAAYDQAYPESAGCGAARSGEESVLEALYASLALRQTCVRFWELKHVIANPYVEAALDTYREFRSSVDEWVRP